MASADLSVLAGLSPEQIAAIGHLFASGALPLPTAAPAATTTTRPTSTDDLEDGEVDDEGPATPEAIQDDSVVIGQHDDHNRDKFGKRRLSSPSADPNTKRVLSSDFYARQEKQLEEFVRTMYSAGYGFNSIKNDVKDVDGLRRMYQKLALSTDAAPPVSQPAIISNAVWRNPSAVQAQQTSREEYLARLQAAKNKKTEVPTTQIDVKSADDDKPKAKKLVDPKKNELLKVKLAALKAKQAARQMQANPALTSLMDRAGVATEATTTSKPLDAGASSHPRVVIDVSEQDDVDSELDESSEDANAGVSLAIPQQNRHLPKQSFTSSSSATPVDTAMSLQQKMQEIDAARLRLAELEERTKSRSSNGNSTPVVVSSLGAGLTAAIGQPLLQSAQAFQQLPNTAGTHATAADDASSVIDDDDDEYDEIYKNAEGTAAAQTTQVNAQEQEEEVDDDYYAMDTVDSDAVETAEENNTDQPLFFEDLQGEQSSSSDSDGEAAVAKLAEPLEADDNTDASMDISDEEDSNSKDSEEGSDSEMDDDSDGSASSSEEDGTAHHSAHHATTPSTAAVDSLENLTDFHRPPLEDQAIERSLSIAPPEDTSTHLEQPFDDVQGTSSHDIARRAPISSLVNHTLAQDLPHQSAHGS